MITSAELYNKVVELGLNYSSWQSDLYLEATPEARALLAQYQFKTNVTTFISQIEKTPWYDIPFAYQPYWDARMKGKA
jgi:hypothetical protein